MRILIAHSFYRVAGGEDGYVRQQMEALGAEHEVELLSIDNSTLNATLTTWARMAAGVPGRAEVDRVFERFDPDVVHLHNVYPGLGPAVHRAAAARGVPIVMTVHNFRLRCPNGYMFTNGEICRRCANGNYANAVVHRCFSTRTQAAGYASALWLHRFVVGLERKVDRFIAPSEFTAERLRSWSIPPERISVVRNFTQVPADAGPPGKHGLYAGRMSPEKGLEVLLEALATAGDPDFVFAGDGPEHRSLVAQARDRGLANARFVGHRPRSEVDRLLAEARFVVMPSRSEENAPLLALEAMAHGRPLIATDLGGLTELTADGRGISVRPDHAGDLAAAIGRLVRDDALCGALGDKARSFAQRALTTEAHVDALLQVYDEVVGDAKVRRT